MDDKQLQITNFLNMQPSIPSFSEISEWQILKNVDPLYYLISTQYSQGEPDSTWGIPRIHEEQVAPLASAWWTPTVATLEGNVTWSIPSSSAFSDIHAITDSSTAGAGVVYGIKSTGVVVTLGAFTALSNGDNVLETFSGEIWATNTTGVIGWANLTGGGFTYATQDGTHFPVSGGKKYLKQFGGDLYYSTSPSAGTACSHIQQLSVTTDATGNVTSATYGLNSTPVLDTGIGWHILGFENYNDNYMVVAVAYSGENIPITSAQSNRNYLRLTKLVPATGGNGITSNVVKSVRIPGAFKDMKMIGDNLYVVITERTGQDAVYLFTGGSLQRKFGVIIDSVKNGFGYGLFNYNNAIGLNLTNGGAYIIAETEIGESKHILSDFNYSFLTGSAQGGNLYGFNASNVYYYNQNGTTYASLFARSNWIDTEGKDLGSIDIHYERIPAGISFFLKLWGKDEFGTVYPQSTITIDSTTAEKRMTTINLGAITSNKTRIDIVQSGSPPFTDQLIIRKVVLNFN